MPDDMVTVWLYPTPGSTPDSLEGWRASIDHPGLFARVATEGRVPRAVWARYDYARRYCRRRDDHPKPVDALGELADAMLANGVMSGGEHFTFERVADG